MEEIENLQIAVLLEFYKEISEMQIAESQSESEEKNDNNILSIISKILKTKYKFKAKQHGHLKRLGSGA